MYLVVGLGNPGPAYQGTRHNIGFEFLDLFADANRVSFTDSKWQALIAKSSFENNAVMLVKPQTYMNESGRAVSAIAAYFRTPPEQIIVIHDDLDLSLGRVKVVVGRGAGGHNGITSLISYLHSNNFVRIRVGIGRPDPVTPVKNFVLTKFTTDEQAVLNEEMANIHQAIHLIINRGPSAAMAQVNNRKAS